MVPLKVRVRLFNFLQTTARHVIVKCVGTRPHDWPIVPLQELRVDTLAQAVADALAQCLLSKAIDERQPLRPDAVAAAMLLANGFWTGRAAIRPVNALLLARWLLEAGSEPALAQDWAELAERGSRRPGRRTCGLSCLDRRRSGDLPAAKKSHAQAVTLRVNVQTGASRSLRRRLGHAPRAPGLLRGRTDDNAHSCEQPSGFVRSLGAQGTPHPR